MPSSLVRIGEEARRLLKELSSKTGESAPVILGKALEGYRRKCFLEEANRAFGELRKKKKAWTAELREREAWDDASSDSGD